MFSVINEVANFYQTILGKAILIGIPCLILVLLIVLTAAIKHKKKKVYKANLMYEQNLKNQQMNNSDNDYEKEIWKKYHNSYSDFNKKNDFNLIYSNVEDYYKDKMKKDNLKI